MLPPCEVAIRHWSAPGEVGASSSAANARSPSRPAANNAAGILRGWPLGAVARAVPPAMPFTGGGLKRSSALNLQCAEPVSER